MSHAANSSVVIPTPGVEDEEEADELPHWLQCGEGGRASGGAIAGGPYQEPLAFGDDCAAVGITITSSRFTAAGTGTLYPRK